MIDILIAIGRWCLIVPMALYAGVLAIQLVLAIGIVLCNIAIAVANLWNRRPWDEEMPPLRERPDDGWPL